MNRRRQADESIFHVERQILRTVMERPSSLEEISLLPHHFAAETHSALWTAIQSMTGKPVDPVSVADFLGRTGQGALGNLALDIARAPELFSSSDARYPAGILLTAWRDRQAQQIGASLIESSASREEGAVDRAISALMELHSEDRAVEHTSYTAMQAALEQAYRASENGGRLMGIPTGIHDLDDTLGGLHDSDLIVIGARPAMGKTGMLLGMTSACGRMGAAGLISGEQAHDQVGLRWLAAGAHVSVGRLRAGKFDGDDRDAMTDAAARYGALPIHILDRSSPDLAEVSRVARRWRHQYGIRALYVDYLQKIEIDSMARSPKHERIGAVARGLKNLARELRIPVVVLAQVNREADGERPQMKHLSDSSEIEKEADQIIMLWRDLTNPRAEYAKAELNIVKNRHGNIGVVHCSWHGGSTSFVTTPPAQEFD